CGDAQKHGAGVTGAIGGIPLYLKGKIAGGIGVDGIGQREDEIIALAGASGRYGTPPSITADNIYLGGIQLPYIGVQPPARLAPIPFANLPGMVDPAFPIAATPPLNFPIAVFAGVKGEIRVPIIDSPMPGPVKLTAQDV